MDDDEIASGGNEDAAIETNPPKKVRKFSFGEIGNDPVTEQIRRSINRMNVAADILGRGLAEDDEAGWDAVSIKHLERSVDVLTSIDKTIKERLALHKSIYEARLLEQREAGIEAIPQTNKGGQDKGAESVSKEEPTSGVSSMIRSWLMKSGMAEGGAILRALGGALVAAGAAIAELLPAITVIGATVAAGVYAYKLISDNATEITNALTDMGRAVGSFVDNAVDLIKFFLESIKQAADDAMDFVDTAIDVAAYPGMALGGSPTGTVTGGVKPKTDDKKGKGTENLVPMGDIVKFAEYIQKKYGVRISGHSKFGGQERGVHDRNSKHYEDRAIDVNFGYGNVEANDPKLGPIMDEIAREAREAGYNTLWRRRGHYDHLHVQQGGSLFFGSGDQQGPEGTNPLPSGMSVPTPMGLAGGAVSTITGIKMFEALSALSSSLNTISETEIQRSVAKAEKAKPKPQETPQIDIPVTDDLKPATSTESNQTLPIKTSALLTQYLEYFDVLDSSSSRYKSPAYLV